jgi:hypothetical protein
MGLFDRLFGRQPATAADPLLDKALDRTVEVVEPKLGLLPDWRRRLAPGVAAAIEFARAGAQQLQQVHDLSAANWSADPLLRAAFANADGIPGALARARELQRWFRAPAAGAEAYAVLGMDLVLRKVLGTALVGEQVRHEVERTQASFGDHRLAAVAAGDDELRRAVGVRIFNQLLLVATRELAQADERRKELNVERALLRARLRMLESREGTLLHDEGECGDGADPAREQPDLRRRLDELDEAMARFGAGTEGLDRQLEIVRDTLLAAPASIRIGSRTLRLDAMNNVLDEADAGGAAVEFVHAQAPEISRAFAAVRVRREDVPAGGLSIAAVERGL